MQTVLTKSLQEVLGGAVLGGSLINTATITVVATKTGVTVTYNAAVPAAAAVVPPTPAATTATQSAAAPAAAAQSAAAPAAAKHPTVDPAYGHRTQGLALPKK